MRKFSFKAIAMVLLFLILALVGGCQKSNQEEILAKYIGVKDYKNATREDVLTDDNPIYEFEIAGEKKCFKVACDKNYTIQNHLFSGYDYYIVLDGDMVTSVRIANEQDVQGIVKGYTPGERTLKNFLSAAKAPMGTTLYVFGGGWDFQDDSASILTRRIGVSPTWEKFYRSQDENYDQEGDAFPNNQWNIFYDKGLDCTGYLGWTLYNTLYDESETEEGFVGGVFNKLSKKYGLGTVNQPENLDYKAIFDSLKPGDIIGTPDHVYIIVGKCDDGSAVIIHSTVTKSSSGVRGGGVQLSAISIKSDEDTNCKAYQLAKQTMETYYPEWTKRYPVVLKPIDLYFDLAEKEDWDGIFSWHIGENGLTDPDGIQNMSAEEILNRLFK